jgi:putative ABC transport system ATP-binding protein
VIQQYQDNLQFDSNKPILAMSDLCKNYYIGSVELRVLKNINLSITAGEYVAIMGPSGSGKSTLLNMIGCLDRPSSGDYQLGGQSVSSLDDDDLSKIRGSRIGFIFQSFNLISQLNIIENIQVPMFYQGITEYESAERAVELAKMVGLGHRLKHKPTELSGGQQQRVAIARALSNDPLIILADEPTGNLDSSSGSEILEILHGLHDQGKTLIAVTHDEGIARESERVIRLFDGEIDKEERNKKRNQR